MRLRLLALPGCLSLICSIVAAQTPTIQPNGVVNAAGARAVVAPGSLISIFGSGLAAGLSISNSTPVSTKLGDVDSVTIGGRPRHWSSYRMAGLTRRCPGASLPVKHRMSL